MKRIKVKLYLEGGSQLSFYCHEFDITKLSGSVGKREINWAGATNIITVDLDKIIGVKITNCLFHWF